MIRLVPACALSMLMVSLTWAAETEHRPLTAAQSDPRAMGWMQGSPPPLDKRLSAADGSFFQFPALRYSVVHMREFLPTVEVSRGLGSPVALPVALDARIDGLCFQPRGGGVAMTWKASLAATYTDGIVVLHRGRIVYEHYDGELRADRVHAAMSMTKSLTGTLAALLAAEGVIDPAEKVARYVPELAESAFAGATVRQVMDMTTCLDYREDYADPSADVWTYARAGSPLPAPGQRTPPAGTLSYLQTVKVAPGCTPGRAFAYKTPNADVLGWVISRATGQSVAALLSDRVWRRLGMEQSGYFQVDAVGTPVAGGGFSAGLRDMARFGQMLLDGGRWQGVQVLPAKVVEDIRRGGDRDAFARSGHPELAGWSYRDMWWITHNPDGAYSARGIHGQALYVDPAASMVIVRFGSHPQAGNAANDPVSLPAYQAVADYLKSRHSEANP